MIAYLLRIPTHVEHLFRKKEKSVHLQTGMSVQHASEYAQGIDQLDLPLNDPQKTKKETSLNDHDNIRGSEYYH